MIHAKEFRRSNTFRAEVRRMLAQGYSASRIAKETGKSLLHVKRIIGQESPTPPDPGHERG
jgi:DNA invertase Pin-like site-specific DNA recombinase